MQVNAPASGEVHPRRRRLRYTAAMIASAVALTAVLGCVPRPAIQFSPATLSNAQVGSPYAATITVGQAETPVGGASIQDGALPAGLDLALAKDPIDTIQISGTPTASGTFNFTIYVWCYGTNVNGQTATQAYTLVVK
jgi:large repetitive protein